MKVKHNSHFTFESVIDSWGMCSDKSINSGVILSFDAVYTDTPVIIMLQKSKQTSIENLGILSLFRDHRTKSKETREVTYTCRYTSEHLIPTLVFYCI